MFDTVAKFYIGSVDRLMEGIGYVPETRCREVFGGVPRFGHCGHVGTSAYPVFVLRRKYVDLGQYKAAYHKILEAAQKNSDSVTFTTDDFPEASLFSFNELRDVQENARRSNLNFLARNMRMDFDFNGLFS